jgi:hypothetical protein
MRLTLLLVLFFLLERRLNDGKCMNQSVPGIPSMEIKNLAIAAAAAAAATATAGVFRYFSTMLEEVKGI